MTIPSSSQSQRLCVLIWLILLVEVSVGSLFSWADDKPPVQTPVTLPASANQEEPRPTQRGRSAKFTFYVAQYEGGDWDCSFGCFTNDRWYGNCAVNLMRQVSRWTRSQVKVASHAAAIALGSRKWIEKLKPPLVFLTGTKDFAFTDAEVENVREYLMLGGAIWVDGPGKGKPFDTAIRRKMKRVLPDCQFAPAPEKHPFYNSYFRFPETPAGLGFSKEPPELLMMGAGSGDVAVLYTSNGYSDLWEIGLAEDNHVETPLRSSGGERTQDVDPRGSHWKSLVDASSVEVAERTVVDSYKFRMNILIFLLTRFCSPIKPGGDPSPTDVVPLKVTGNHPKELWSTADSRFNRAMEVWSQGNVDQTIELLENILREHPTYHNTWSVKYHLGLAYKKANRLDEAARQFKKIVEKCPDPQLQDEARAKLGEQGE